MIFERGAPKVMSVCRRYSSSKEESKDLFQECFYQILKSLHRYDPRKGEFEGWLFQVSYYTILNIKKSQVKFFELNHALLEVEPEINYDAPVDSQRVMKLIQDLPEGYRMVLNMFVFEGLTHEEIADELGIAISTSRSQLARARALLKKTLSQNNSKKYVTGSI